jgi:hypothetical protein
MESGVDPPQLGPYSQALFDAVVTAVPAWITRRVHEIVQLASSGDKDAVINEITHVAHQTQLVVSEHLMELLSQDVDAQRSNPLHILRQSTSVATAVLHSAHIPPVRRDEFDTSALPNDVYAIGPHTWRDLSEEVHEAGITWGAWKAATVIQRRRAEGKDI